MICLLATCCSDVAESGTVLHRTRSYTTGDVTSLKNDDQTNHKTTRIDTTVRPTSDPARRLTDSHRGWQRGETQLLAVAVPRAFRRIHVWRQRNQQHAHTNCRSLLVSSENSFERAVSVFSLKCISPLHAVAYIIIL